MDVNKLAPSEIRYSQDSISNTFRAGTNHTGQYIGETLDEIVSNPDTADLIPNISVFNKDDKWFTLDNRRLWVFKKAQQLNILSSIDVYVTFDIPVDYAKFTTKCDGKRVDIRRINPGGNKWQSLEKNAEEQKRQEVKQQKERKRKPQMEIERKPRVRKPQMEIERKRRVRKPQMEIERKPRVRKQQMEIDQQQKNINIIIALIVSFILAYLGMTHHHND
jgi:hypothetical protein